MITSSVLEQIDGVQHAFFTRHGGVSEGIFASLNCGLGSSDAPGKAIANRNLAMEKMGLTGEALVTAYQIHSATVAVIDGARRPADSPRADGLVTRTPGVAVAVLTADCAPVLFADRRNRVIGAAHAGWRGARGGILEATVAGMCDLGARTEDISAAIGPSIGRQSYEVGPEFHADFLEESPANNDFFTPNEGSDRYMFDLPSYVGRRLEALNIGKFETLPFDTFGESDRFFSYRRAVRHGEKDYGRGLSAIALL